MKASPQLRHHPVSSHARHATWRCSELERATPRPAADGGGGTGL